MFPNDRNGIPAAYKTQFWPSSGIKQPAWQESFNKRVKRSYVRSQKLVVCFVTVPQKQQNRGVLGPLQGAWSTQGQWTSQSAGKEAKQRQYSNQQDASQNSGQYHVEFHISHGNATHNSSQSENQLLFEEVKFPPAVNNFRPPSSLLLLLYSLKQDPWMCQSSR